MNENVSFISKIASDISHIEYNDDKTFRELLNEFYSIMRKYGLKQYNENGGKCSEWMMCEQYFLSELNLENNVHLILKDAPEDLRAYEK